MVAKKRKIKKQGRFKKIFFVVLLAAFAFSLIGFLVFSNLRMHQKRAELISQIQEIEQEIQLLEEKNEQLKTGIVETTESEAYWEARVREQGYKRPGEEVIVVLPPAEEKEKAVPEEKTFLENLLDRLEFYYNLLRD